jgi:hypothetical protein
MTEQSDHLRAEAARCEAHARALTDVKTQVELRKLVAEYIARAVKLESE